MLGPSHCLRLAPQTAVRKSCPCIRSASARQGPATGSGRLAAEAHCTPARRAAKLGAPGAAQQQAAARRRAAVAVMASSGQEGGFSAIETLDVWLSQNTPAGESEHAGAAGLVLGPVGPQNRPQPCRQAGSTPSLRHAPTLPPPNPGPWPAPTGHGAELRQALGATSTAVKAIASRVARAGLEGLYGAAGSTGGSGDAQKKLDVVAVRGAARAAR